MNAVVKVHQHSFALRCRLTVGTLVLHAVLACALLTPSAGFAGDPPPIDSKEQQAAPTAFAAEKPQTVLSWGIGDGKSYLIPALDIVGEELLLNLYDRHVLDDDVYGSNFSSFWKNATHHWVVDSDPFDINQFQHPYQGSMYHGFARSAGLSYWESAGYTFAGSLLWELAGETGPPSTNDQVSTGIGGSFLGEPLFRLSSLLLESGGVHPGFWRELGAALIQPSTGFNRLVFGDRFDGVFPSNDPAVFTRVQLGASLTGHVTSQGLTRGIRRQEASADITVAYGLPGKPDYSYTRPFDYFHFQFTAATGNVFENIMSRGLLYGKDYEGGDNYRGIWGIYGSYDYIAPQIFRVSSTAVSLGTTGQWWLARKVALQGTALVGVGYGAAGTIHGSGERDYHYGLTPQELLALRLIFGDRASFDVTARYYYVSGVASTESNGSENVLRADMSFTVRVYKLHGITIKYVETTRDAHYPNQTDQHQSAGTVSLAYTYLGQTRFGAVDWRPKSAGGP